MEVTREMFCPTPGCKSGMSHYQHGDPSFTVVQCENCKLFGVLGDDRLIDAKEISQADLMEKLKTRAAKVVENKKELAGRFTEPKLGQLR